MSNPWDLSQQEIDVLCKALKGQGLTWSQTNFAVSLVRRALAKAAALAEPAVRSVLVVHTDDLQTLSNLPDGQMVILQRRLPITPGHT